MKTFKAKFATLHDNYIVLFNDELDYDCQTEFSDVVITIKNGIARFRGNRYHYQWATKRKYFLDSEQDMKDLERFEKQGKFKQKKTYFTDRKFLQAKSSWMTETLLRLAEQTPETYVFKQFRIRYIGK